MNDDDLLERLLAAETTEERSLITFDSLLDSLASPVRDAVWAGAVPNWFDVPFLAALLEQSEAEIEAIWPQLIELSLVSTYPDDGYRIRRSRREILLERLWNNERARYRELSRRAAEYCAEQVAKGHRWRMEEIYHLLIAEPDVGADALRDTCREWHDFPEFAMDRIDTLTHIVLGHAAADRLEPRGLGWALLWKGYAQIIFSRYDEARASFEAIDISRDIDTDLFVHRIMFLGLLDDRLGKHASARERFEEAVTIYREIGDVLGEAHCLHTLGELDGLLREPVSARERFEAALAICRQLGMRAGEASCIHSLGDVDQMLGEYESARERYRTALALFRETGDVYGEAKVLAKLAEEREKP